MILFLIKKSFFDAWDNLAALILGNFAVFIVLMAGLWPAFALFETGSAVGIPILILLVPVTGVVAGAAAAAMKEVSDYRRVTWGEILPKLKETWKTSLGISVIIGGFFALSMFGMSYYSKLDSMVGLIAMALLFWVSLAVYLSMFWFFPAVNRLTGGLRKNLKKSGLLMLDNLGLSLFGALIIVPINMILWPMTAFGAFGPAGISIFYEGALRLLMFKYDWMEQHPEAARKDVPWYELLIDEKERVGKRTLKGMIFPWKD